MRPNETLFAGLPDFDEARSASSTIKGYLFQFDATIAATLKSNEDTPIRVEGVEDFDVATANWTACVQCKYYEATELTAPVIRDAILPMLRRLKAVPESEREKWKFSLYGHFKNNPTLSSNDINLTYLKSCLTTYKVPKKGPRVFIDLAKVEGFDDGLLSVFAKQFSLELVPNFDSHRDAVKQQLKIALVTNDAATTEIHYPAALTYVASLAAAHADRVLTRDMLLNAASPTSNALNSLLLRAFGDKKFCSAMRQRHFSVLNREPSHHTFVIHNQPDADLDGLLSAVREIARKYNPAQGRRRPIAERCVPIVLLLNMPAQLVSDIKSSLISNRDYFNDGFSYSGATFDPAAALGTATPRGPSQLALLDQSKQLQEIYDLRRPMAKTYSFSSPSSSLTFDTHSAIDIPIGGFSWILKIV